jgi:hypothetical protein
MPLRAHPHSLVRADFTALSYVSTLEVRETINPLLRSHLCRTAVTLPSLLAGLAEHSEGPACWNTNAALSLVQTKGVRNQQVVDFLFFRVKSMGDQPVTRKFA